ncbi:hypothetical protein GDO81_014693, partial [Engystomops pustulosus]
SYVITFILGTMGNGLVIWLAGFKMKKTAYTIWFLNLGVVDFASCVVMPFVSIRFVLVDDWSFGEMMCKTLPTLKFLMYFSMWVSTALIMIISVDRCICILCPVWSTNHRTPRRAVIVSVIVWLLSFIISLPNFNHYYVSTSNNSSYCTFAYANEEYFQKHKVTRFVSMFLIPFLTISTCYVLAALRLRKKNLCSKSKRPFKVIASVVLCFFFCWFPFHIKVFLKPSLLGEKAFQIFWYFANFLAYFNCCLNPIIYVFTFHDFKSRMIKSIPLYLTTAMKDDHSDCVT